MLLKKVREAIKKYKLIAKGDIILVAVSGGPDSIALLYLLYYLKDEFKIRLHVAHLDHNLRRNSYKDKEFVCQTAKKLGLPVSTASSGVKEFSQKGSREEVARDIRMRFLFRVAKDIKADKIALGHNFDDQAETVLMRILRGTGLNGLAGILPKRHISDYEVIRPLLGITRREIEGYLKEKKILPCRDPSNTQDIYFRNRIRNHLFPILEKKYNLNIKEALNNLGESAGYDYDYLSRVARRALVRAKSQVNLGKLKKLHPAIRRLVLRFGIAAIKGDTRRISFRHIEELEDLIFNRPMNSVVDLPKNVSVVKRKSFLRFYLK